MIQGDDSISVKSTLSSFFFIFKPGFKTNRTILTSNRKVKITYKDIGEPALGHKNIAKISNHADENIGNGSIAVFLLVLNERENLGFSSSSGW
jgi:hypothetical protein